MLTSFMFIPEILSLCNNCPASLKYSFNSNTFVKKKMRKQKWKEEAKIVGEKMMTLSLFIPEIYVCVTSVLHLNTLLILSC